jgi:cytoskeletal protein CcmA (bactofilin family)
MNRSRNRNGMALLVSLVFLATFTAWSVSVYTTSTINAQIAHNQRRANGARANAESGLDIIRYWLQHICISGTTAPADRFALMAGYLQTDLAANGVSNVCPSYDGSQVTIPNVALDSSAGQSFSAVIQPVGTDTLQADVTGYCGTLRRTIRVNYGFGTRVNTVFDFGVATRGPLHLAGNIELEGTNVSVESSVYIESNDLIALSIIGNSHIAGDVSITNPNATAQLQGGKASIGGETGEAAIKNHVFTGVPPTEFPTPNPNHFEHYVTSTINSSTNTTTNATYENAKIVAGTNPVFSGNVIFNGVVFIETPNVVTFTGNTTITGLIVGDGDTQDNSGTNKIIFLGNVESQSVSNLPDLTQFAGLKDEKGTFVLAPGFAVSLGGSFSTLNGAIAGNGIEFFGNAGGTIQGSIINYSDDQMTFSGNSDLHFNRSGTVKVPAGFAPEIILRYDASSYQEVVI